MLSRTPNCSCSSPCIWLLATSEVAWHRNSSQWRTGGSTLAGCPCLPSWRAASPRVRASCLQREAVARLVWTPAAVAASCQDTPASMSSSICCLAARRCSCSMLVPCSLFSQASFCSLLYHNSSWYLSLDRQGRFLPDTLIQQGNTAGTLIDGTLIQ